MLVHCWGFKGWSFVFISLLPFFRNAIASQPLTKIVNSLTSLMLQIKVCQQLTQQGALPTMVVTTAKTSPLKWVRVFTNVAIIPTRFKCQMWVKFRGVEFLEITAKFRKRKKNSSSCVHAHHENVLPWGVLYTKWRIVVQWRYWKKCKKSCRRRHRC